MGYRMWHGVSLCALLSASVYLCGAQETGLAVAPTPGGEVPRRELSAPKPPRIQCGKDRLEISADGSTLSSILNLVGSCLGLQLELPAGFADERTFLKIGSGTPRDVLNTLLNSMDLNFVMQVSTINPGKVTAVILTDRAQDATNVKDATAGEGLMMTPARRLWLAGREAARPTVPESVVETGPATAPGALVAPESLPSVSAEAAIPPTDSTKAAQTGDTVSVPPVPVETARAPIVDASKPAADEGPPRTQINQMQEMFEQRRRLSTPPPSSSAPQ